MVTAIVYRDCPAHHRQYLRRIAGPALYLWHADIALALPIDATRAKRLATWFQLSGNRSRDIVYHKNYQPAGEYGTEEVPA